MGCGSEVSDWDDRAVKDSLAGKNTLLDPKIENEVKLAERKDLVSNIDKIIEEAIGKGKSVTSPEIMKDLNRALPTMTNLVDRIIAEDRLISVLPEKKEDLPEKTIKEYQKILLELPKDAVIYREGTVFLKSSVKEAENPKILFDAPMLTKESLKDMAQSKASRGNDGKRMEIHHWRRENEGPRLVMTQENHRIHSKQLHGYKPSKPVKHNSPWNKERNDFWKQCAQEYLGEWYDSFKEGLIEEE